MIPKPKVLFWGCYCLSEKNFFEKIFCCIYQEKNALFSCKYNVMTMYLQWRLTPKILVFSVVVKE